MHRPIVPILDHGLAGWRRETRVAMDTFVTFLVAGDDAAAVAAMDRAFTWFEVVERTCSRFDQTSELSRLCEQAGQPAPVSALLFELLRFALGLARASRGAFDPTIGQKMVEHGFNREYRTGKVALPRPDAGPVSFRDVHLDAARQEVTLAKPLTLDLNAVAKGLAIDLAARELASQPSGAIDAGGDLFYWGTNPDGLPWRAGIQHPADSSRILATLPVTGGAVCTTAGDERQTAAGHHVLDPRTGEPAEDLASVTVLAPTAMAADGLATAAFVLGRRRGKRLLFDQGVRGVFVMPDASIEKIPTSLELIP